MSSRENPSSPSWTYRMEVSPTGAPSTAVPPHLTDPVALLQLIANLQSQNLEIQRQVFEMQKQQLELTREAAQFNRDQRARQIAELERWQQAHEPMLDFSKQSLTQLEEVHAALMRELADYVDEHHENLVDGDFALSDFVDKFGPKLAHLNTMLAVLRPLAAAAKKAEGTT